MQDNKNQKGRFGSNFGFLMATLGAAVGLGNLWSFPYKLGIGGGFGFLFIYNTCDRRGISARAV
jgi:NSS family neurotransmitter:Na+ symporter